MADEMLAVMQSEDFREYIKHLSSDKYGVDLEERKVMTHRLLRLEN
jgi:hypothetical protein